MKEKNKERCKCSWTVREIRKHYVTVRFSDKEFEKLDIQMRLSGYHNRSRYIRDALISVRTRRRNFSRNEANLSKQVELLRGELRRIGVNYNQRVKTLNTLALMRDRQGRPVVTARDVAHDMSEMKKMMEGMVRAVSRMEEVIRDNEEEAADDDGDYP